MRLSKQKDMGPVSISRICQLISACVRINEISHEKSDPSITRKFHYPNSFGSDKLRTSISYQHLRRSIFADLYTLLSIFKIRWTMKRDS